MKRLLAVFLLLCLSVGIADASIREDLQVSHEDFPYVFSGDDYTGRDPESFGISVNCSWVTPCNLRYDIAPDEDDWDNKWFQVASPQNIHPETMNYIAANVQSGAYVFFYDAVHSSVGYYLECETDNDRLEVVIYGGGIPKCYVDGVLQDTGSALSQYPSFVKLAHNGAGTQHWDDFIFGDYDSENKYMVSLAPPVGRYVLIKDILNPTNSGLYTANGTVLVESFTLPFSWSRGNISGEALVNDSIDFINAETGVVYQRNYTGVGLTHLPTGVNVAPHQPEWNLTDFFYNSGAPYGIYRATFEGSSSEIIAYIGSGATIAFDRDNYGVGDTATMIVNITDSYFDDTTYTYKVKVMEALTADIKYTQGINPVDGGSTYDDTATYIFNETNDDAGLYYALLYADPIAAGDDILMAYDYAELSAYTRISGYVKDAETELGIEGAQVDIVQGIVTSDTVSSGADGNYTSITDWSRDVLTSLDVGMAGYESENLTFTTHDAGDIQINVTLIPLSPTYYGIAIGGVVKKPPYYTTVDSATVTIMNASSGYSYDVTTNSCGYYIKNYLPLNNTVWDIWGSKTGFSNSTIYQLLAVGS